MSFTWIRCDAIGRVVAVKSPLYTRHLCIDLLSHGIVVQLVARTTYLQRNEKRCDYIKLLQHDDGDTILKYSFNDCRQTFVLRLAVT